METNPPTFTHRVNSRVDLFLQSKKIRSLTPLKVVRIFFRVIAILLLANLAGIYINDAYGITSAAGTLMFKLFDFNTERNIPTLFSCCILFIASALLFYLFKTTGRPSDKRRWLILSFIFLFLTFDEGLQIHERLNQFRYLLHNHYAGGLFYYFWEIPYLIFFLVVVAYYFKFVVSLPVKTRNLFFLSGFLYVAGAVGFEMFEGYIDKNHFKHLFTQLLYSVEEPMEMCGVTVFIYALLDYLFPNNGKLSFLSFHKPSTSNSLSA